MDDPIGWIYLEGYGGGGPIRTEVLQNGSTGSITLPMNQSVSNVVESRPGRTPRGFESEEPTVSDKVLVTITPLPAEEEKRIVEDATRKIDAGYRREESPNLSSDRNDENAHHKAYAVEPDIATLRYLQTPAARAALLGAKHWAWTEAQKTRLENGLRVTP